MKISILTVGTRGDVQPYIALARGLMQAGHQVRLGASSNFESFVTAYGVEYAPLRADYYDLMDSPEGRAIKSGNPLKMMQMMKTTLLPLVRRMLDDAWDAARDADAIIFHPKALAGAHLGEKLGVPVITAMAVPALTPTGVFPVPGIVNHDLGAWLNRKTYALVAMSASPFNGVIRDWRRETLGLPEKSTVVQGFAMNGRPLPALYAFSQHVLPRPADWDKTVHVTGYWFLEAESDWQPPADLEGFLAAGAAPVYVGFGSMIANDPERVTRIVIEAVQQSGQRAVLATGWGGLREADLPTTIFRLKEAPHDWLFPRMSAVVHHGGAGTTAAGLRAGKPGLIVPFMVDQPFWGNRLHQLGVAPKPIPQKKLTVEGLASAIRESATDPAKRVRAEAIGEKIRAEDGVAIAVKIIENYLSVGEKQSAYAV